MPLLRTHDKTQGCLYITDIIGETKRAVETRWGFSFPPLPCLPTGWQQANLVTNALSSRLALLSIIGAEDCELPDQSRSLIESRRTQATHERCHQGCKPFEACSSVAIATRTDLYLTDRQNPSHSFFLGNPIPSSHHSATPQADKSGVRDLIWSNSLTLPNGMSSLPVSTASDLMCWKPL